MTSRIRRFTTVGTLMIVLFLAGAGAGQARDLGSVSAWGWLQGLWSQSVSWLGGGQGSPARHARSARELEKQGYGLDPDGFTSEGSSNGATTSSAPLCTGCGIQ